MDRAGSLTTVTLDMATLYLIPLQPSADLSIWDTGLPAELMSVRVSQKLGDKMARADFEFAGKTIGGTASSLYGVDLLVKLPDHTGASQIVFRGAFRDSKSTYSPEKNSETMPAFDAAWYLTMNPLDRAHMSLLTPAQQQARTTYRLYLRYGMLAAFKKYDWVLGGTSGATGMVTDLQLWGYPWIEMTSVTGTFQDGEMLYVGSVQYAYADGHAVDVTGTVVVTYPDNFIRDMLGGDNWGTVTGINPYRIQSTGYVWGSGFAMPFRWNQDTKKITSIEDIAKKLNYFHLVKLSITGEPREYCIDEDLIDDPTQGLDLPAEVTFVKNSPYLAAPVVLDIAGGAQYNKITLRCLIPITGVWYEASLPSTDPEKPVEMVVVSKDIATITEADERLAALYAYYTGQIRTWTVQFCARTDLRFLQKLIFSGSADYIPDGEYRIVGIEYYYAEKGTINTVTCTIVPLAQFKAYLSVNQVTYSALKAVQALARELIAQEQKITTGTATTVGTDGVVVAQDGLGVSTSGRDPSS